MSENPSFAHPLVLVGVVLCLASANAGAASLEQLPLSHRSLLNAPAALYQPLSPSRDISVTVVSENPYGFSAETTAADCASACHLDAYWQWEDSVTADLPPIQVWDEADEAAWTSGDVDGIDPDDTTELGNLHSLSWKDWYFQRIYHDQPPSMQSLCQRCHMPYAAVEATGRGGVYAPMARSIYSENSQEGITCVSCHLDESGAILGANTISETEDQHAVVGLEEFADGVGLCATCHNDPVFGSFSRTATEHLAASGRTAAGDKPVYSCMGCHMAGETYSESSHSFPGGRSNAYRQMVFDVMLPVSLAVGEDLQISILNHGAGHNAPTGDKFRAFSLRVRVTNDVGETLVERETFITPIVRTPVFQEVVTYERVDAIGYVSSEIISYGLLPPGDYELSVALVYYQTKATELKWFNGTSETVDAFGEAIVNTWNTTLSVGE